MARLKVILGTGELSRLTTCGGPATLPFCRRRFHKNLGKNSTSRYHAGNTGDAEAIKDHFHKNRANGWAWNPGGISSAKAHFSILLCFTKHWGRHGWVTSGSWLWSQQPGQRHHTQLGKELKVCISAKTISALIEKTDLMTNTFEWTYAPAPEAPAIVKINGRYELFIGGKFVRPQSKNTLLQ